MSKTDEKGCPIEGTEDFGTLTNLETGKAVRPANDDERHRVMCAEEYGAGDGVEVVDGRGGLMDKATTAATLAGATVTDRRGRVYTVDSVDFEEAEAQRPAGWFAKMRGGPFGLTWEPVGNLLHFEVEPHLMASLAALVEQDKAARIARRLKRQREVAAYAEERAAVLAEPASVGLAALMQTHASDKAAS